LKLKVNLSFSKIGVTFGLTLALSSVLAAGLGTILMGKRMMAEDRAFVQQSIGDSSNIIGKHFKSLFEQLAEYLTENAQELLVRIKNEAETTKTTDSLTAAMAQIRAIEISADIVDLSIWKRGAESSAFDLFPAPKRAYLAVNTKYEDPSSDILQQLQAAELAEKPLVQPAFQGHTVIVLSPKGIGEKNTVFMAIPVGKGSVDQVISVHIQLHRFQSALIKEGMVSISLVDDFGNILAHADSLNLGKKEDQLPLFQEMHTSNLPNGQMNFEESGSKYFGGYSRVGIGNLAVLAQVPESEISAGVQVVGRKTAIFLVSCFFSFFLLGYIVYTRTGFVFYERRRLPDRRTNRDGDGSLAPVKDTQTQKVGVTVLFGSLRQLQEILDYPDPSDSIEALNDFFSFASSLVKLYGGAFEKVSGSSFIGVWGIGNADGTETWCAIRCGLELRKSLTGLNSARKVDGQKHISIGMGVHSGLALVGRIGPVKSPRYTIVGDVIVCAKYLARLSDSRQTDLLVSQEVWSHSEGKFLGEQLGEAKLTQLTGMMGYFSISGYRNEKGEEVRAEISPEGIVVPAQNVSDAVTHVLIVDEKKVRRWTIDNGSQMVGPLTEQEIASRLFTQEIDFDCECWSEGAGNSSQIKKAGIFSGSEDPQADIWLYDGKTIHGPVSFSFIKTAQDHGAIEESTFVCEQSTIQGWVSFAEWVKKKSPSPKPQKHSNLDDGALRASLAPPVSTEKTDPPADSENPQKKAV
jgi:class 3 adenylate cyclase